ncbi:MAG: PhnD/SsuA/transferrin family substrate-binding protein, partial [Cytophagales bacterium]|nr:PhnD/SsuA/transferrin family substrate-binding protein [Rhizobacter sp.]
MRRLLLKLPLLALWPHGAHAQTRSDALRFGVITTTTVQDSRKAWEPFFADMRAATGMPVQGWYAESYLDAADALVTNTVQLAWVSSKTA